MNVAPAPPPTSGVRPSSGPVAVRLAMGCFVLALAASLSTCRLDKLIKPAIADRLDVSPPAILESANAGSTAQRTATLRIESADGATLPWRATKDSAWLTLSLSSGGAPTSLVVTLHSDSLSEDVYQDMIVFTSTQTNDTVRVPVTFDILPPAPELSVTSTSLTDTAFAGSALPHTDTIWIDNTGSLPLTWSAAVDSGWLTISKASGGAPPQDTLVVTLTPGSLPPGTHAGTVTVTAPGAIDSLMTVPVTFTIRPCEETGITLDTIVTNAIALSDCGAPQRAGRQAKVYAVQANAGDTLSFRLTAAFNPWLILTNSSGATVLDSIDVCGAANTACIVNYPVTTTGRYVLEATTRDSGETGAFTLSAVKERAPSPPQSAGQFREDSTTPIATGGVTPEDRVVFRATLNDPNPGDSVRLEVEAVPLGSNFTNTNPTHRSGFFAVAPAGRVVAVRDLLSGLLLDENFGYHWQARTCDQTGRCSAWVSFGQNAEAAPDFFVNAIQEDPPVPTSIGQFQAGGAPIPVGGNSGGGNVVLLGTVSDPDPGDQVRLEVEAVTVGTTFNNTATNASAFGAPNRVASTTGPATLLFSYHWQARTCDQTGRCSAWVSFPQPTPNPESSADYVGSL